MAEQHNNQGPHPDLLQLELLRTDEAPTDVHEHVERCPRCQGVLAELNADADGLRLDDDRPAPAAATDQAVLEAINARAGHIAAKRRRVLRTRITWAAAAVVALVLALLAYDTGTDRTPAVQTNPEPVAQRQDVNADGAVDIVDAMLLARKIETGAATSREWDFDNDGTVDTADVELLAQQSVALEGLD